MTPRYRVSADIGGTFTDLVFQDRESGDTFTGKIPSTPQNPAGAVLEGLKTFMPEGAAPDFLIHGTTVGLNSVLERKGARVALVSGPAVAPPPLGPRALAAWARTWNRI